MIEAHVIFRGKVQGVFFRRCICNHVKSFRIVGVVRNKSDGTVEAFFQGEKLEIEKLIAAIEQNSGKANLDQVDISFQSPQKIYPDFSIDY